MALRVLKEKNCKGWKLAGVEIRGGARISAAGGVEEKTPLFIKRQLSTLDCEKTIQKYSHLMMQITWIQLK